jgi:putative ABC transport system permease protein
MNDSILMQIRQFSIIYVLLLLVLLVMKQCHIDRTKQLLFSSFKMTVQLMLAGFILTYIFGSPNGIFTALYLAVMVGFAIHRVLNQNPGLSLRFKVIIALSILVSGLGILAFFVKVVVRESLLNPQYVIPLGGMLLGNTMNSLSLGIKTFRESLSGQRARVEALTCIGAKAENILRPFLLQGMETAMLPTLNNMAGMGIVSLPGMMTGQILAGSNPMTAIFYQISIMIAICTIVTVSSFAALYFGCRTMYSKENQLITL